MLQNEAGKQVFGAAESVGRSLFSFACLAVSGQKEGAGAAQGLLSPAGSRNEQTSLPLAEKGGGGLVTPVFAMSLSSHVWLEQPVPKSSLSAFIYIFCHLPSSSTLKIICIPLSFLVVRFVPGCYVYIYYL